MEIGKSIWTFQVDFDAFLKKDGQYGFNIQDIFCPPGIQSHEGFVGEGDPGGGVGEDAGGRGVSVF